MTHDVLFSPLASNSTQKTASEQRLTELVENSIEVVAMEKEFARSLLEFLLKAIIIGMVCVYYNIKVILEGIITCLRTDLGCLEPKHARASKWH